MGDLDANTTERTRRPNLENTGEVMRQAGVGRRPVVRTIALILVVAGVGAGIAAAFLWQARNAAVDRATSAEASVQKAMETMRSLQAEREELKGKVERLERENAELLALKTQLASDVQTKGDELAKAQAARAELEEKMKAEIKAGDVSLTDDGGRLRVNLVDKILFDSGDATISKRGADVLTKLGAVFGGDGVKGRVIQVSGHTDDAVPTAKIADKFPTNWELSTTRATNVVRFLSEQAGVPSKRLVATGYGQFRPVASNNNPQGRARNRRIEIVLVPEIDAVKVNNK